jgi:hypothetical protein
MYSVSYESDLLFDLSTDANMTPLDLKGLGRYESKKPSFSQLSPST